MKINKRPTSFREPLLRKFRALTKSLPEPKFSRLQGRFDAPLVVLGPHPQQADYDRDLPWADEVASAFFGQLLSPCPKLDHNTDFLVLPLAFSGLPNKKGTSKGGTDLLLQFIEELVTLRGRSVVFLCSSPNVFKAVFREGAASEPEVLCGYWLFPPLLGGARLLVFPDPKPLTYSTEKDDYDNYRAFASAQAARNATLRHYDRVLPVFGDWITKKQVTLKLPA